MTFNSGRKSQTVDVIIPIRNGMPYLHETLNSVFAQKMKPNRIIALNNHSTDGSLDYLESLASIHPEVEIFTPPSNLNKMADSWNYAISLGQAPWFILLSCDDLIHPKLISRADNLISHSPDVAAINYRSHIIDETGKYERAKFKFGLRRLIRESALIDELAVYSTINVASVLVRRAAWMEVGGFDNRFLYRHDLIFWQDLASLGGILKHPQVLGKYRVYNNLDKHIIREKAVLMDLELYVSMRLPELKLKWDLTDEKISIYTEQIMNPKMGPKRNFKEIPIAIYTSFLNFFSWIKWRIE